MPEVVKEAKEEFSRAQHRLTAAFNSTPTEKQEWSPSATCRTPIQLVVHVAQATDFMRAMTSGEPMPPMSDFVAMDAMMRSHENGFTAESALELLDKNCAAYIAHLDTISEEKAAETVDLPFGKTRLGVAITFAADHIRNHAAQLEYLQTSWGDHEWRF